jgi:hypothetical protein
MIGRPVEANRASSESSARFRIGHVIEVSAADQLALAFKLGSECRG